jgi:hypothetical protein
VKVKLTSILLGFLLCISAASASTYNYDVSYDVGGSLVTGTFVTDTNSGALAASDFVSWSLTYQGTTISGGPTVEIINGDPLTATATGITFDPLAPHGAIVFSANNLTLDFDSLNEPGTGLAVFRECALGQCNATAFSTFTSALTIANGGAPIAATPLPAALPLFAGGLSALGLLGWRRKRKAAAQAA